MKNLKTNFVKNCVISGGVALLGLCSYAPLRAAETVPVPQFQDGDVVCFLGDSITHSRKYHSYVYNYYLTRFPDRKIRFVNAGISGDSAGGALRRLEWDVLPARPNVVSIMLGMNDVNRGLYGKTNPDEANLKAREAALAGYRQNMGRLVQTLTEKLHPRFVFATPSPYDQTVQVETENLFGVNEALAQCGAFVREMAAPNNAGVVDFHGPMTQINLARQKENPKFTLIGSDRVHPQDTGQMVMAYLYLKAQQVPAVVSDYAIDFPTLRATKNINTALSNIKPGEKAGSITFDCLEKALPFPVEDGARGALELVPLEADFNQQRLAITGLAAAKYRLSVDNQNIGDYSAAELQAGINLAFNNKTPQYQQAQQVANINERRRQLETRLRSFAQVQIMLNNAAIKSDDDAAVQGYFTEFINKLPSNQAYFRSQFDNYAKTKPQRDEIKAQIEQLTQELWQKNQPVPHRYELAVVE